MPKSTKGKVEKKSTVEADDDKDTKAAIKERLRVEIRSLQLLIAQAKSALDLLRFGDLSANEDLAIPEMSTLAGSPELIDIDAVLINELCSLAGLCCKKVDDKLVVAFQSVCTNWCANNYWVQLSQNQEGWKLGQWMMPVGIDVNNTFAKYPMSTSANIKHFLKECKHLIDCHNHREQEFKRLEAFMRHMERYGCSLETSFGYTNVIMKLMMRKPDAPSNDTQKIVVHLWSRIDNARFSRIFVDREGENELPQEERRRLSKMFHCFKELDMVDAAKQVLAAPDSVFIWKDPSNDDSIVEINGDEGVDMDTSFLRLLQQKSSVAKKRRGTKSEAVGENSNDTREKDLRVDVIDVSDAEVDDVIDVSDREVDDVIDVSDREVDDVDVSQVDRRRSTKRKLKTPKEAGVNKIITAAKTNAKSKNTRASGKGYFPSKDCNQNIISSFFKNAPGETAEETSKNNDKGKLATPKLATQKLATPKFFKSKHRRRNNTSSAGDEKSPAKRKNTDVEDFERKIKKSRANGIDSVSSPRGRSAKTLQCSTPLTECASVMATIGKANISAIAKVNTTNARRVIDAKEIETTANLCDSINGDTDDSDENDLSEVCNDHEALLKDLQAVKYDNNKNATRKAATKSTKQKNVKVPLRGRNKFPKK